MSKVLIAMSGGVDSSVTALLMQQKHFHCLGCTMLLNDNEKDTKHVTDARSVAERLQMPFEVFDCTAEFQQKVIQPFIDNYERGMTPNPCIECNRALKFGTLYQYAQSLGCDYLVTGHYARIEKIGETYYLKKAVDQSKDQSYFLYHLTATQLAHIQFPLGAFSKTEVRRMAREHGLSNADKQESQDICFVPDGDYARVIQQYTGKNYPCGDFIDQKGQVLGQHRGIIHYTVGQRKGLAISAEHRLYVREICPQDNTVRLCQRDDLAQTTATAENFHWINGVPTEAEFRCQVKIRYNQKEQPATVKLCSDNTVEIIFDQPQMAVTPGQAAVLYQDDIVLGGGILVEKSLPSN